MKTIGSHVVMAEDDLAGAPPAARGEKPEGVLLLYRQREINDVSLAAFVHALLAALQRDELHVDLIGEALARSGFVCKAPASESLRQQRHDELMAMLADVMTERMCDDLVLRGALTRIAGDVLTKLTWLATTSHAPALQRSGMVGPRVCLVSKDDRFQ